MPDFFISLWISVVFGVGGYFCDSTGLVKQPAYFALWGYCSGLLAGLAVVGVFK